MNFIIETPTKDMCELVNSLLKEHGYSSLPDACNMGIRDGEARHTFNPQVKENNFVTFQSSSVF